MSRPPSGPKPRLALLPGSPCSTRRERQRRICKSRRPMAKKPKLPHVRDLMRQLASQSSPHTIDPSSAYIFSRAGEGTISLNASEIIAYGKVLNDLVNEFGEKKQESAQERLRGLFKRQYFTHWTFQRNIKSTLWKNASMPQLVIFCRR